jgi:hypothetical protein
MIKKTIYLYRQFLCHSSQLFPVSSLEACVVALLVMRRVDLLNVGQMSTAKNIPHKIMHPNSITYKYRILLLHCSRLHHHLLAAKGYTTFLQPLSHQQGLWWLPLALQ